MLCKSKAQTAVAPACPGSFHKGLFRNFWNSRRLYEELQRHLSPLKPRRQYKDHFSVGVRCSIRVCLIPGMTNVPVPLSIEGCMDLNKFLRYDTLYEICMISLQSKVPSLRLEVERPSDSGLIMHLCHARVQIYNLIHSLARLFA